MYTEFHLNSNELDINFLQKVKEMFKDKSISIIIEEEKDETKYLLESEANKKMLLDSIKQVDSGELISVNFSKSKKK